MYTIARSSIIAAHLASRRVGSPCAAISYLTTQQRDAQTSPAAAAALVSARTTATRYAYAPCPYRALHQYTHSNVDATAVTQQQQHEAPSSEKSTAADEAATPASTADSANPSSATALPHKRKSRIKIFPTVSARRKDFESRLAEAQKEEQRLLEEEEEQSEEGEHIAPEEGGEVAAAGDADAYSTPDLSDSQIRGILAKRAALQAIHPLKMLITSPRHGLDKIRVVPHTLQRQIDNILRETNYVSGQNEVYHEKDYALWHVANRSAIEFGVLTRIFDEVVKRLPSLNPHSLMDYGAATSMSLFALNESLEKYANKDETGRVKRPIKTYRVIENNLALAKYGSQLTEVLSRRGTIEMRQRSTLPPLATATASGLGQELEKSSVVVAPFSLSLLTQQDKRNAALEVLWASVAPAGVLILVEAGTIEGFELVRTSREHLLDKYGMRSLTQKVNGSPETAANVVAPCGSNNVCPLGDKSLKRSCWHRTEILTSSLPMRMPQKHLRSKEGVTVETFSYLVLHKGPIRAEVRDAEAALAKWKAKEKDLYEVGQQGWMGKAREESFQMQEKLKMEEEARLMGARSRWTAPADGTEAKEQQVEQPQAAPTATSNANADANTATASGVTSDTTTDATPPSIPVTKRSDLTPVAHLLPCASVPANVIFEQHYSRIMRKPLKRGEHVVLDLCNEESKLERRVIPKSYGIPYTLARAVSEGDLWPLEKRKKDPNAPPTIGELRKQKLKERKEKRKQKWAEMDEEERLEAQQEFNKKKREERAQREKEREERIQAKKDAMIIARGGTVPDRTKPDASTEERLREEREDIIFMEEGELDKEEEARLQKFRVVETKKENAKREATPAVPEEQPAAEQGAATSSDHATSEASASADTTSPSTQSAKPKPAKNVKPLVKTRLGVKELSFTGGVSRMPNWMETIMHDTRRADGGGLDYTGKSHQKTKRREEDEDWKEGEYVFEPEPAIAKSSQSQPTEADLEELQDAFREEEEKAIGRKLNEKQRREKSPLATKRAVVEEGADPTPPTNPLVTKPATARTDKPRQASTRPDATKPAKMKQPKQPKSHTSSTTPTASASPVRTVALAGLAATAATPAAAGRPIQELADIAASNASAPTDNAPASPTSPHLPKWAKFRTIKQGAPIAATPENTAAWPAGSKDAVRNIPSTDAEWQAIEERARQDSEKKQFTPAQISFFKREEARKKKTATNSSPSTPSSLPPHLAALRAEAMRSPANARYLEAREKVREYRDARTRQSRDGVNRTKRSFSRLVKRARH